MLCNVYRISFLAHVILDGNDMDLGNARRANIDSI